MISSLLLESTKLFRNPLGAPRFKYVFSNLASQENLLKGEQIQVKLNPTRDGDSLVMEIVQRLSWKGNASNMGPNIPIHNKILKYGVGNVADSRRAGGKS